MPGSLCPGIEGSVSTGQLGSVWTEFPVSSASIVPIAFPMIAGSGTLTTILSLRAEYSVETIAVGIGINLVFIYLALHSSDWIHKKLGQGGTEILRKVFGIILLTIAVKLFRSNVGI
jgi:multiple antibiotic resistance protein